MRGIKKLFLGYAVFCGLFLSVFTTSAAGKTIESSPYVSITEDGKAWTTNAGDTGFEWYPEGEKTETGIPSSLRELGRGEHYYRAACQGAVPVGYWKVQWRQGQCIHNSYPKGTNVYHGIPFGKSVCQRSHYSGWMAYCADCGGVISNLLIYMSREAAGSIDYLRLGEGMSYYYLCPFCRNMEQAAEMAEHMCKAVSYNQYQVRYHANCGRYGGYMENSIHMYGNADTYEGKAVTPMEHLSLNGYVRTGYLFQGWNTEPDGTGTAYADGAKIWNLTDRDYHLDEEGGTVRLYAQWKAAESTLRVDPAGGRYGGSADVTAITQGYGTVYKVEKDLVEPPAGHKVSFECNGGSEVPDKTGTMHFKEWKPEMPFHGSFEGSVYRYGAGAGEDDLLTACYGYDSVTLPSTEKSGSSFGGWYYDAQFQYPAGAAGDVITPEEDMTLYAQWVSLTLSSKENYQVNGGKGAVDLTWAQPDDKDKWYLLYQSTDGEHWERIFSGADIGQEKKAAVTGNYKGSPERYVIEHTGLYTLTAAGAQGGGYGAFSGGQGGIVTASFWLRQGEVLTYTVGGADGYNGGGAGSLYAGGGGCTVVSSDQKGVLLVAGGGGGATDAGSGGAGGSEAGLLESGYGGETGGAGGGGGYRGGMAGERILHYHTDECYRDTSYDGLGSAVRFQDYHPHVHIGGNWDEDCQGCFQYKLQRAGSRERPIPVNGNTQVRIQAMLWKQICRAGELGSDSYLRVYNQDGICFHERSLNNVLHNSGVLKNQIIDRQDRAWEQGRTNLSFPQFQTEFVWELPIKNEDGDDNGGYTKYWSVRNSDGTSEVMGEYKSALDAPVINLWGKSGVTDYPLFPDGNLVNTGSTGYVLENIPLFFVRNSTCVESGVLFHESIEIPAGTTGIYVEAYAKGEPAVSHDRVDAMIMDIKLQGGRDVICGMEDGQEVSSKPSYGGSNYVNTEYAYSHSQQIGVREGDGSFTMQSVSVGYTEEHHLDGVLAPDMAPPDAVDGERVRKEGMAAGRILVTWEKPKDHGTIYYHVAESYFAGSGAALCRSNETINTLTSGVKGYFYCVDEVRDTEAAVGWEYTETPSLAVAVGEKTCYLHLAAADVAGNISETIHIPLDADAAARPLHTKQLSIDADEGNIYPAADKKWYVRSDGATPFTLQFDGYIDGRATENYQINYAAFVSGERGETVPAYNRISIQNQTLSEGSVRVPDSLLGFSAENMPLLTYYPYTQAYRDDGNRKLSVTQKYTLDRTASGKWLEVYPSAGARWKGETFYSPKKEDMGHGLTLIGDGEPPVIQGMDIFENLSLIDRRVSTPVLSLTATDALSGVRSFNLTVYNGDNNCSREFYPDEAGVIRVALTSDDPLFSGDFTAIAYAADNVGNETSVSGATTEFGLTALVERILPPHAPVFQNGESGILTITAWGYPDYVEIEFPEEMTKQNPELNRRIEYAGSPRYCQEEKIQFMIPLYTPANADYTVTVRAYKGDRQLEQYPELSVVEVNGTVLDDFRTRLR